MDYERKFYISWDTADTITVENLKDTYEFIKKENEKISALDDIPEHVAADLVYNLKMIKALQAVLAHFGADVE